MHADVDVSVPAALIGEPARAAMLVALLDGRSLPAGELARAAKVTAPTASEHLSRLTAGGLTTVTRSGRHRYYTLSSDRVAQAVEALQALSPARPVRSLRDAGTGTALAFARSCYDHLAGHLAIELAGALISQEVVAPLQPGQRGQLLDATHHLLTQLGVDTPVTDSPSKRPTVRGCLDWTHRQPHLAGHLGFLLLRAFISNEWLTRAPSSRALRLTEAGRRGLEPLLRLPND